MSDLPKELDIPDEPSKSQMVAAGAYLLKNEDNGALFNIDPKYRQALVNRIYARALKEGQSDRVVLRAAQVATMFDRVNLAYRLAGFGDFSSGQLSEDLVDLSPRWTDFARAEAFAFAKGESTHPSKHIRQATPLTLATFESDGRWLPARHLAYLDERICNMIYRAEAGVDGPRIILVDAPPRHGKSEYCSKWLPAWFVSRFPDRRVMLASYSDAFSKSWGRSAREQFAKIDNGLSLDVDARSANEWRIAGHEGGMITAGIGGSFTGRGAHLMLVDDPIKNADEAVSETIRAAHWEWWQSTAWTRLEPNAVVLVIMTRWHDLDLAGRIKKWGLDQGLAVEQISLPALARADDPLDREIGEALWPERMSTKELQLRRDMLDAYWWESMYQGMPGSYGTTEWPDTYFDDIFVEDGETWPSQFDGDVIAMDPSKGKNARKGDYSAMVFAGLARGLIWIDCDIKRRPVPVLCADAVEFAYRCGCDRFGVETNTFQELLMGPLDEAAKDAGLLPLPTVGINNTSNKQLRISRLGPWLARKKFRIRRSPSAELLVQQLRDYPHGQHDDGPDAMEMALRLLRWFLRDDDRERDMDPDVPERERGI